MKWTPERINKFKKNPLYQLSRSKPRTYFFFIFSGAFFGAGVTHDIIALIGRGPLGDAWYLKYIAWVGVATGVFFGERILWKKVERAQEANKEIQLTN